MHDIWKPSFQLEQSVLVAILKAKEKAPAEQTRRDQRTDLQALSYKQGEVDPISWTGGRQN
jgi:hypothetical protein